jgi:hypothetical protein
MEASIDRVSGYHWWLVAELGRNAVAETTCVGGISSGMFEEIGIEKSLGQPSPRTPLNPIRIET